MSNDQTAFFFKDTISWKHFMESRYVYVAIRLSDS